jgi:hypothetical protein
VNVGKVLFALVALALVVASLGIDQVASSASAARHVGFGYPVHFAASDFTTVSTPPAYPQTYRINPWEVPVEANFAAFMVSWILVYLALHGAALLLRSAARAFRRKALLAV